MGEGDVFNRTEYVLTTFEASVGTDGIECGSGDVGVGDFGIGLGGGGEGEAALGEDGLPSIGDRAVEGGEFGGVL